MTFCAGDAERYSKRRCRNESEGGISKVSLLLIVMCGVAIFFVVGVLPEIKKWRKRDKNIVNKDGKVKVKLTLFGIPILRRKE